MVWRPANSLLTLRDQVDARWPNRSRASDGIKGDRAHQKTVSDHNPDWRAIVRAIDITNDPSVGCVTHDIAHALIASHDRRIAYVIADHEISGPLYSWAWFPYSGDDPHISHLHLSVVSSDVADETSAWQIESEGAEELLALMRYSKRPEIFLTNGVVARHVPTPGEIVDIQFLANEGTLRLGYGGQVRVVDRPELIGKIVRPPAGWEAQAA